MDEIGQHQIPPDTGQEQIVPVFIEYELHLRIWYGAEFVLVFLIYKWIMSVLIFYSFIFISEFYTY